jgi:hypothetical protein
MLAAHAEAHVRLRASPCFHRVSTSLISAVFCLFGAASSGCSSFWSLPALVSFSFLVFSALSFAFFAFSFSVSYSFSYSVS